MRTDNLIEKSTMTSGVADNNSALFADLYGQITILLYSLICMQIGWCLKLRILVIASI